MLNLLLAAALAASTVTAEQLRTISLKDRAITIVDVRGADAYAESHIYGAINIPASSIRNARKPHASLRKDREIYFYCTCPEDGASLGAARVMRERFGYTKVAALHGGMYDWEDAGYPMVKGRTGTAR